MNVVFGVAAVVVYLAVVLVRVPTRKSMREPICRFRS
jgi:hypothetical protein